MNKMSKMARKQKGFTLIEIAIVLVIIGLLLGGVLQGQQLIENSRVRAAANDISGIRTAVVSYQDRYNRLPGDDGPVATLRLRGAAWTPITVGGDSNGTLTGTYAQAFVPAVEALGFWQHLRAAGFITGDPATIGAPAAPTNPFGGVAGVNALAAFGIPAGPIKVCMNNVNGTAARALDVRLDDGNPATGIFRAEVGTAIAATTAATAYVEESIYVVCQRL